MCVRVCVCVCVCVIQCIPEQRPGRHFEISRVFMLPELGGLPGCVCVEITGIDFYIVHHTKLLHIRFISSLPIVFKNVKDFIANSAFG